VAFHLENDANAAALGEFYFSGRPMPDNFLLVTLGTGIGSGAVINRRILTGGDGNALELGHIVSGNGRSVEQTIGKAGLIKMAKDMLAEHKGSSALRPDAKLDDDAIIDAANAGDPVARRVLDEYGRVLGQALVSAIFLLDIKNIYIGGGVAKGFAHMEKGVHESLNSFSRRTTSPSSTSTWPNWATTRASWARRRCASCRKGRGDMIWMIDTCRLCKRWYRV
jgi:glucokinase